MIKYLVFALVGYYVYVQFFWPKISSGTQKAHDSGRTQEPVSDDEYVDYEEIK